MKYTLLIFSVFIALTLCSVSFLGEREAEVIENVESRKEINDFFKGLFEHFKISKPSQILDCFSDSTANLFYRVLRETNNLLCHSKNRDTFQSMISYWRLRTIQHGLHDTWACVLMTQDFSDLLDTLEIEDRNPKIFELAMYIHYQARYSRLSDDFKKLIGSLDSKDHRGGGDTLGCVIDNLLDSVRNEGLSFLAFSGFSNGISMGLDIDDPDDRLRCYNNKTGRAVLEFLYSLSVAVTNRTYYEAPFSTLKFWENEGKDILSKVHHDIWACDANSKDIRKASKKLGVRINSEKFFELMLKYIDNDRLGYYVYLEGIKYGLENHDFILSGSLFGHFLKSVASTSK